MTSDLQKHLNNMKTISKSLSNFRSCYNLFQLVLECYDGTDFNCFAIKCKKAFNFKCFICGPTLEVATQMIVHPWTLDIVPYRCYPEHRTVPVL